MGGLAWAGFSTGSTALLDRHAVEPVENPVYDGPSYDGLEIGL